jgi:excisionase family DNA binding protein
MATHSDALLADGLVPVSEAAAFLGVSRSTLYALMERGELPYVKIGRARRVPRRALITLAAARLRGALQPIGPDPACEGFR